MPRRTQSKKPKAPSPRPHGALPPPSARVEDGRGRLAEQVAARLERDIIEAGWPVGEVFGSEAELCERYGVSRAVLREAARLIEHHQVARMRRGVGGGLVITEPKAHAVTEAMAVYLRYRGVETADLVEARRAIELRAVHLAAERMTEDGIIRLRERLQEENESVTDPSYGAPRWHAFHILVADLSGNPTFGLFTRCLVTLVDQAAVVEEPWHTAVIRAHQAHVQISEALIAGDTALAEHRMARHLDALEHYVDPTHDHHADATAGGESTVK
jgi:DNA-binding FadR family transcriptional regulator